MLFRTCEVPGFVVAQTLDDSIKDEKRDRKRQIHYAWIGVGIAVVLSLFSICLNYLNTNKLTTTLSKKYSTLIQYNTDLIKSYSSKQEKFIKSINKNINDQLESINTNLSDLMKQLTFE